MIIPIIIIMHIIILQMFMLINMPIMHITDMCMLYVNAYYAYYYAYDYAYY